MIELLPFVMFLAVCLCLLAGYPVALTLAGVSFLFALLGALFGLFDMAYLADSFFRLAFIAISCNSMRI